MAKQTSLEISIAVDSARVKSDLERVQAAFRTATSGINASLASIKGFADLKKQTEATTKAYGEAQRKVADLAREIKTGAGGAALARDFALAKVEAGRLKQTLDGQQVALHRLRRALADGGVDTANLGAAQSRLRGQLAQTTTSFDAMARAANARDVLGISRHAEIQAEIAKTRAAYKALAQSGQASAREQAQAWVKMQDKVVELRGQMNGFGEALGAVKAELIASGVAFVGWGRGVVGAIQEAIRFEAAFADVKKVVDGTPAQLSGLSREIIGLGRSLPVAHAGLAQIAAMGGQMGLPVAEIGAFTQAAAAMGTAFSIPAEQVGQAVGTLKSIFGLTIPEVVGLGDNINVLGNTMATNEAAIIEVLTRIGGSVKVFGLAEEKAAALGAAMLELGQSPEVAATSINTLLSRLQTANVQTPQFKEALESIGLSAEQMAAMVSEKPQQAIDTLLETLGRLGKQEQAEALTRLFGAEYQDNIALLVQGVDSYRNALAAVDDQAKVLGSTEREAAERNKTTAAQLQLLKNAWAEVAINVGNVFLPALNTVVGVLREVTGSIATLAERFPGLTQALTLAAGAATVFFAAFAARKAIMLAFGGEILNTVAALKKLGPVLADGVKGLNALGTTATTVQGALGQLGALLVAWELGQWVGEILGSFDVVKKGALTMIHTFDLLRLSAQKAWAVLTGGDVGAVERQMEAAKTAYSEMLAEIDKKGQESTNQARKQVDERVAKPQEDAAAREQAANDAIMAKQAEDVKKMAEEQQAAREAKQQAEEEARKQAEEQQAAREAKQQAEEEARKQAEDERAKEEEARLQAEEARKQRVEIEDPAPARPEPVRARPAAAVRALPLPEQQEEQRQEAELQAADLRRMEERAEAERAQREDQAAERRARADEAAVASAAAREQQEAGAEAMRARRDEARQASADRAREAEEAAAAAEEQRQADAARAAEEQAERFEQLQEEQAQAAEDRMAAEREATEEAKSIFERYAERVKSLQEEIGDREKSLADDLAEMDPNADEATKWQRRAAEAKKYEKAAKAAMEAGDLDEAQQAADEARRLYKQLASGAEGVDKEAAKRLAYGGVRTVGQLGLDAARAAREQEGKQAQVDLRQIDGLNSQLMAALAGKLGELTGAPGTKSGPGRDGKPTQVHEIKLGGARLSGSPADVSEFIRQLELAGMTA